MIREITLDDVYTDSLYDFSSMTLLGIPLTFSYQDGHCTLYLLTDSADVYWHFAEYISNYALCGRYVFKQKYINNNLDIFQCLQMDAVATIGWRIINR